MKNTDKESQIQRDKMFKMFMMSRPDNWCTRCNSNYYHWVDTFEGVNRYYCPTCKKKVWL